jgi:hypothetical protein
MGALRPRRSAGQNALAAYFKDEALAELTRRTGGESGAKLAAAEFAITHILNLRLREPNKPEGTGKGSKLAGVLVGAN